MPTARLKTLWPSVVTEPYETRAIEYKQSAPWADLQCHIARTALALANLRDGGIIVIGVSEGPNGTLEATGMTEEHLATYVHDDVHDFVNRFSQTRVTLRGEVLDHDEKNYYVVDVEQFETAPVVTKRGSPGGDRPQIRQDTIYCRPAGKAETAPATAEDLREIIDIAVEAGLRQYLQRSRRAGATVTLGPTDEEQYDNELGDL